jgi:opacity protein-like surface antigen
MQKTDLTITKPLGVTMTFNKNKLALSVAAASISLAMIAPQAVADTSTTVQTELLQNQMQQMAEQMKAMQAELDRVKAASATAANTSGKVQELDQWMASVKGTPEAASAKDNLVVVRGGWEQLDHARSAGDPLSQGGLLSNNRNASGFLVGGAFDFNVNNDLFGFVDNTSFLIELGFEYGQFGTGVNTLTTLAAPALAGAQNNSNRSTDARLRLNASPKIKFLYGSKFRPWIIPVGLELNVLGVPSNAVSVLSSGMQFGAGAEYELFRGIVLGTDFRYHYATGSVDGTVTNGVSAGGYVGFKF